MKRVTTNMSFGQLLFVLLTIITTGMVGFYLGIKFGPQVSQLKNVEESKITFLPEDALAQEIKDWLKTAPIEYSFFEVVQNKKDYPEALAQAQTEIPIVKMEKTPEAPVEVIQEPEIKKEPEVAVIKEATPLPVPVNPVPVASLEKSDEQKIALAKIEAEKKMDMPELIKINEEDNTLKVEEEFSQTKYLLQIGSYDSVKKAEKAKDMWAKRGFRPEIVKTKITGKGDGYRLRLGLLDDYSEIQAHQKDIQKKYRESAVILPIQ